jgi:hypothetical protein
VIKTKKLVAVGLAAGVLAVGATRLLGGSSGEDALSQLVADHHVDVPSSVDSTTLRDSLPNVTERQTRRPISRAVVRATVVDVQPGRAQSTTDPLTPELEGEGRTRSVDFDDKDATYRWLNVTLHVDDVLAGDAGDTLTLEWMLAGKGAGLREENPKQVERALRELGSALWIVPNADKWSVDYSRAGWVAQVADDGRAEFVFHDPDMVDYWQGDLHTTAQIEAEARKPGRTWDDPTNG